MTERELLESMLTASPDCLSPQQLEQLVGSEMLPHPHVAHCSRCQAELALLKSFMANTPLPDEGASVAWISARLERERASIKNPERSHSIAPSRLKNQSDWFTRHFRWPTMRWAVPMTVAAAVIVVVSVALLRPSKPPELQANLGQQPAIYRSQEVQLVSPIGQLPAVPQELRWQGFEGADRYEVTIMEIDHSQLWSSRTKENSISIPAAIRTKMLPGKPILWQVTALNRQGQALATSQVQEFVSPRPNLSKDRAPSS